MYDNIDFIFNKESSPGVDFLATIPQHLTHITNQGVNQFGEYVTGYLDSLQISITDARVKIYNSSLCKYYLGNNFKTLSRSDGKKAIEKISDCLHLPFERANVTRIDAAHNLVMKQPERAYYSLLGQSQFYSRLEQNNGLYYNNQLRQLVFYGKEHEQKDKGQPIPELYRGRFILRYELRYYKRLRQQFNRSEITAALLSNEIFYRELVNRLKAEYMAIKKINSKFYSMKPTGRTKEFISNLALLAILEMGQPNILNCVKIWQETGQINKKQAYDLRVSIHRLSKTQVEAPGSDLIIELDRKVKEAAQYG